MKTSWPGAKQLRAFLEGRRPPPVDPTLHYTITIDLAPMGEVERVIQLKMVGREIQRARDDAWEAYQERS